MTTTTTIGLTLVILFSFGNIAVKAQGNVHPEEMMTDQSAVLQQQEEQEPISNNELIKLSTNTPNPDKFSAEEDYLEAKEEWVRKHPDAYERLLVGPKNPQ